MVAVTPPPPIVGGDLKISDQNNWGWGWGGVGGNLSKKLNLGGGGELIFRGGPMNPNDAIVVVLRYSFMLIRF